MSLQIYEEEARKLNNILFKEENISLKEKTLIEIIKK